MAMKDEVIVGIDVGTTKVVALVAEASSKGTLEIGGVGTAVSSGIKNGTVINMDSTSEAIQKAVHEAELMAGRPIENVVVSISGNQIRGFNSHGQVAVPHREVREDDVRRVIEAAQATKIPEDRQLIHTLPQGYIVDSNEISGKPVGMAGVRMEVKVHIVTCAKTSADNLITCCNRNNLTVNGLVFSGLASSEAALTDDEKELGVAHVDIGGGTADIVIWHQGAVIHTASIPFAGELITNDIAQCLRTPRREAEKIKTTHGCTYMKLVDENEEIQVPGTGGRPAVAHKRQFLCDIIEPRMEEIIWEINEQLQVSGFVDLLGAGLVLTGGTANLSGIDKLAEELFEMPVRIGYPRVDRFGGLVDVVKNPAYSAVLGLVSYCAGNEVAAIAQAARKKEVHSHGLVQRIKDWAKRSY